MLKTYIKPVVEVHSMLTKDYYQQTLPGGGSGWTDESEAKKYDPSFDNIWNDEDSTAY